MDNNESLDADSSKINDLLLEKCIQQLFMAEKDTWVDLKLLNLSEPGIWVREFLEKSKYVEFQSRFRLNRYARLTYLGNMRIADIVPIPYKKYKSK